MASAKELSTQEKQLIMLGRTLQALREEDTEAALIAATLDYIKAEFDFSLVWISLYDRLGHQLVGKVGVCQTGEPPMLKRPLALNPGDLLEQVVIQQRPIGVPDLREESRAGDWRQAAKKLGIQGTVIFPVRHKTSCFGVVLLGSTLWGVSPHSEEKARLSTVLGALAASLHQLETDQQRQKVKRPVEPLMSLLTKLRSLPSLKQRLEAIIDETHRFINPDRTNIYWFEAQRRYFWRRMGSLSKTPQGDQQASGITAQEVNGFYQAMASDQLVAIGEAQSSLKADMTGRLMQQIGARSLIAGPIMFHGELLGFMAVEGHEPRIWTEEEKNFVRGAAHLIALTAPLEEMEETVQQVKQDQALTSEVSHAIYSDEDWKRTLTKVSKELGQRLHANRLLVLTFDRDLKQFDLRFQSQPNHRKPIAQPLDALNEVDWQMIERSTDAVAIENLEDDLKLMAWRQVLLDVGVRSLLVCSTSIGQPLEGLLVICNDEARTWGRTERDILRVVSQQVGVILHQWQLQQQVDQHQRMSQALQWGLTIMQQSHQLDGLERSATQHIAQVMQVPLATLITWMPGRKSARITAPVISNNKFSLAQDCVIPIFTDTLLQLALQHDGLLSLSLDEISVETRQWLNGADIAQVLVMALRTAPEHEPIGVVLLADKRDRKWSDRQLSALGTLVSQLAWSRRYLTLTETLTAELETLERMNWYKNRRLDETYRTLGMSLKRLNELSHQKDALSSMRFQQILRQLGSTLGAIAPVLKQEQWQLQADYETIPLATLLKRSLERVEGLIKQRRIWAQVHNNEGTLSIGGDIAKIEFVMHELLLSACYRSPAGGRLDIWCRPLDIHWLEISVTDNGIVEPRMVEELHIGRPEDLLAPSTLDQPPGLHLSICQSLMQQLGGEFNLYKLEDGRVLSRLIVHIAGTAPPAPVTQLQ